MAGRPNEGLKIVPRKGFWNARFRWGDRDYDKSTGVRVESEAIPPIARTRAAEIYASVVSKPAAPRISTAGSRDLAKDVARWAASLKGLLDDDTIAGYVGYSESHWG